MSRGEARLASETAGATAADSSRSPSGSDPALDQLLERLIPPQAVPREDAFLERLGSAQLKRLMLGIDEEVVLNERYELLETLGQGGMGTVYRVYDRRLDREVALKRPHASADEDPSEARDTSAAPPARGDETPNLEAQALARLRHPNVVPVYEIDYAEGLLYITMELVREGETLDAWVARARPDWRAILRAYVDAGRGLAAAHEAGLLHRDFKPSNCVRDPAGRVRVIDFGLALAFDETPLNAGATENDGLLDVETTHTHGGNIAGTLRYMAPEQRAGDPLSPASDQFAFN